MSSQKLRAITFDAAGTLIHLAEPVGKTYSRVASRFGILAIPEKLEASFKAVWMRTPLAFSPDSHIRDPNEKEWWRRLVRLVFEEAGSELPSGDEFDIFFEALYGHFETAGTWVADPAAAEVLEKTSASLRCLLLSNFDARLRRILDDLGLLVFFENQVLSCEIGASKPDPAIFRAAVDLLGIPPGEILHVGDDPICDWQGASSAGFRLFKVGKGQRRLGELLDELSLA